MSYKKPKIFKPYPNLVRNDCKPLQQLHVRLVQYEGEPICLDIREYVISDLYSGYNKKGVMLTKQQLQEVIIHAQDAVKVIQRIEEELSRQDQEIAQANEVSQGTTTSQEINSPKDID